MPFAAIATICRCTVTGQHASDRLQEVRRGRALDHEAAATGRKHLTQAAGVLMRRQRDASDFGEPFDQPFDQCDAVDARQRDVDHRDVGDGPADAFKSLRQDVRKQFLQDHPDPLVPSFSLAAVSDATTTSKMLLEAWKLLTAYDPRTDSQLLQSDALIPGGNFLGILHADHLAVALNYENVTEATIKSAADHNHYPRVALFEAAIRFAAENIATTQ